MRVREFNAIPQFNFCTDFNISPAINGFVLLLLLLFFFDVNLYY